MEKNLITKSGPLVFLFLALSFLGAKLFFAMPREELPAIKIPMAIVKVTASGYSAEEIEGRVIKFLESKILSIPGIKTIESVSYDDFGIIIAEFVFNSNLEKSIIRLRNEVNDAKSDLQQDINSIEVREIDIAEIPVFKFAISIEDKSLEKSAGEILDLRLAINSIKGVGRVRIVGMPKRRMIVKIDPLQLFELGLDVMDVAASVSMKNIAPSIGSLKADPFCNIDVSIDGTVSFSDLVTKDLIKKIPIIAGNKSLLMGSFSQIGLEEDLRPPVIKINGKRSVIFEISKTPNSDLRTISQQIKEKIANHDSAVVIFDLSTKINEITHDLFNGIILSTLIVCGLLMFFVRFWSGILVSISIFVSFSITMIFLWLYGYTINMVVLFSLIFSVGMLVDPAIVVNDCAENFIQSGNSVKRAYSLAAKRMFIPTFSSTLTTQAAFFSLCFWPGVVGKFMSFMPLTIITALATSQIVASIFVPSLAIFCSNFISSEKKKSAKSSGFPDSGFLHNLKKSYGNAIDMSLKKPKQTLVASFVIAFLAYPTFFFCGNGTEFFPAIEPDGGIVEIHSDQNLSLEAKIDVFDQFYLKVVNLLKFDVRNFVSEIGSERSRSFAGEVVEPGTIGLMHLEFMPWTQRRRAVEIFNDLLSEEFVNDSRIRLISVRGVSKNLNSKPQIQMRIYPKSDYGTVSQFIETLLALPKIKKISSDLPPKSNRINIEFDSVAHFNAGISDKKISDTMRFASGGLIVGRYFSKIDGAKTDITIVPTEGKISPNSLGLIPIKNISGLIAPIDSFIGRITIADGLKNIKRINEKRAVSIEIASDTPHKTRERIERIARDLKLEYEFSDQSEDIEDTKSFIKLAAFVSTFMIILIVLIQFGSIIFSAIIISAAVLSVSGALFGLALIGSRLSITMFGFSIVGLSGIVVNNNILLLDAYSEIRKQRRLRSDSENDSSTKSEDIKIACLERLRAICLTAGTTVIGLIPLSLGICIDFIGGGILSGSPSSQWWIQASVASAGGVCVATLITLIATPAMIKLFIKD